MSEIFPTKSDNYETNSANHVKKLVFTALVAIVVIGLVVVAFKYITAPKHGDKVDAPIGLEKAVEKHLEEKLPGIKTTKITYHYCEFIKLGDTVAPLDNYVALVEMEKKRIDYFDPKSVAESLLIFKYQKVFVREKTDEWKLESFASLVEKFLTETHPCEVARYSSFDR